MLLRIREATVEDIKDHLPKGPFIFNLYDVFVVEGEDLAAWPSAIVDVRKGKLLWSDPSSDNLGADCTAMDIIEAVSVLVCLEKRFNVIHSPEREMREKAKEVLKNLSFSTCTTKAIHDLAEDVLALTKDYE